MSEKAIIVLSGGQDSTTCLYLYKHYGYECHAISFDYGQRHKIELSAAKRVAQMAEVANHEIIPLGNVLRSSSPLTDDTAILEQYDSMDSLPGGIEKTFVPMRNQLFLTIAANRAHVIGASIIVTGVCEEDYGGYPDCRDVYIKHLTETCRLAAFTGEKGQPNNIKIVAPLMRMTKMDTVYLARNLTGCWEALAYTHTGYDGTYPPTGHDHATLLRAKGFRDADLPDPLILRAVADGLMDLPLTHNYDKCRGIL